MKKGNTKAFTLIELIVVITIMFILSMMVYAPYHHFQTKQKVRNSTKIIAQTLYEARGLAINGINSWSGNVSIWVYFWSGSEDIILYKYKLGVNSDYKNESLYLLEKRHLEPWVEIIWVEGWSKRDNGLFVFTAITWSGAYYYYNGVKQEFADPDNVLDIHIGFKWVKNWNLSEKVEYYTKTYIAD